MKDNLSREYRRFSHPEAFTFGTTVYNSIKGNPLFPTLQEAIDDFKPSNDAFGISIANAKVGGRPTTIVKKECHVVVIDKLDDLAVEVNKLAKGDEKIILASGFEVKTITKRSVDSLAIPTGLKAEDDPDHKGSFKTKWKNDPDTVSTVVEFQIQGEADAPWQNGGTFTANSATISGLPSGKYVAVRIYSTGRKGLRSDTTDSVIVLVS